MGAGWVGRAISGRGKDLTCRFDNSQESGNSLILLPSGLPFLGGGGKGEGTQGRQRNTMLMKSPLELHLKDGGWIPMSPDSWSLFPYS